MPTKNAPKMLSKTTPSRLRAEQNSVEFCFLFFCVFLYFWESGILHTFSSVKT